MRTLVVTAAVIARGGKLLITKRRLGVHLGGYWEFPGGKCEPGETLAGCLARELREELGIDARIGREIFAAVHAYQDRIVELHFLRCRATGTPCAKVGQEIRWVSRGELRNLRFPPADAELIRKLSPARRREASSPRRARR